MLQASLIHQNLSTCSRIVVNILTTTKPNPVFFLFLFMPRKKHFQPSESSKCLGLSSSPILAEAKESVDSTDEREETESSESNTMWSWRMMLSSSISDTSDPSVPKSSLFIADFAVSTNHSSSGSALIKQKNFSFGLKLSNERSKGERTENGKTCKQLTFALLCL